MIVPGGKKDFGGGGNIINIQVAAKAMITELESRNRVRKYYSSISPCRCAYAIAQHPQTSMIHSNKALLLCFVTYLWWLGFDFKKSLGYSPPEHLVCGTSFIIMQREKRMGWSLNGPLSLLPVTHKTSAHVSMGKASHKL